MNRPGLSPKRIRSIPDPGPPTLAEAVMGLHRNVQEAAEREQAARRALDASRPGDAGEMALRGWIDVAVSEKAHWRGYLTLYQRWLELHPELADRPLGAKCSHGPECRLDSPAVREVGADDDDDLPPPLEPHWSDDAA